MKHRAARPIGRLVAIGGVLLLGVISATRLPIAFQPAWSKPELSVDLTVPGGSDLDHLTRRWVQPLESSIRAAGEVRGTDGEVSASRAFLRARFAAGTDAERKAARLESELLWLRRRLPAGARLTVSPVGRGAGDWSAIVWLDAAPGDRHPGSEERLDPRLVEALRDLPEVRSVVVMGEARQEVRITARRDLGTSTAVLAAAIDHGLRFSALGQTWSGGRLLPVQVADRRQLPFGELPIRRGQSLVPLRALADIELRRQEPPWIPRLDGARGTVLAISREVEASPLALERSLRRTFAAFGLADRTRSLIDEAAPLRLLLSRLLGGMFAATVVAAALAAWLFGVRAACWQFAALPVALAAACTAFWLTDLALDVTTLPALAAGLGCALFFVAFRSGVAKASRGRAHGGAQHGDAPYGATPYGATPYGATPYGATPYGDAATILIFVAAAPVLPIAVALAGGALAPLLAAPARAFMVAAVAGVGALWLLPRARLERGTKRIQPPRRSPANRILKWAPRNPWTMLLGAAVACYLLLVLSGRALVPRQGNLAPAIGDLEISLRFAEGATSEQAADQVITVEAHLAAMPEIESHWSVFNRRSGRLVASVRRQDRPLSRLAPLARRLQAQLSSVGASAMVKPLAGHATGDRKSILSESLEDRPETDKDSTLYRLILRHTDVKALQLAHRQVMDRLAGLKSSIFFRCVRS